ncbi:MAG: cell division protein ZipA C-terminal FtsZ-binding domain-containing protein [Pseudomonadota bacterium]
MNLQFALVVLGAVILVAIYLAWKWQERRNSGQPGRNDELQLRSTEGPMFSQRAVSAPKALSRDRVAPVIAPLSQADEQENAGEDDIGEYDPAEGEEYPVEPESDNDLTSNDQRDDQFQDAASDPDITADSDHSKDELRDHDTDDDEQRSVEYLESDDHPSDNDLDADEQIVDSEIESIENDHSDSREELKDAVTASAPVIEETADTSVADVVGDDIPELDTQIDLVSQYADTDDHDHEASDEEYDAPNAQSNGGIADTAIRQPEDDNRHDSISDDSPSQLPVESDLNDDYQQPENSVAHSDGMHGEEAVTPELVSSSAEEELSVDTPDALLAAEVLKEQAVESERPSESTGFPGREIEGFEKLSQIDYWVKLSGERNVSRDSVLAIYRAAAMELTKAHSIHGLRVPEKVWCNLEDESEDAQFADLVITIQLADYNGGISESELTRFTSLISKLSETTGRGFSFMAPVESALEQAETLNEFREYYDSIFVVNIKPMLDDYFEGPVIDRYATQLGLERDNNSYYTRYKPVGKSRVGLYSLANLSDTGQFDFDNLRLERTRGVTFFTKPAINRSPGAVFAEMVDTAKAFASRIKGEPIAPGQEDLTQDDVDAIRRNIEKVASEMEAHGVTPGSEEASRLF